MMAPAFRLCESHPGKPLTGHLQDVANRLTACGWLGRIAGLFHDVAKGTEHFQHYLKGQPVSDLRLKQHAHLGAVWLLNHLLPKVAAHGLTIDQTVLAYLMVAHHHTGLKNALESLPPSDDVARGLWAKQLQALDLEGAATWLAASLGEPVQKPDLDLRWAKLRVQLVYRFSARAIRVGRHEEVPGRAALVRPVD